MTEVTIGAEPLNFSHALKIQGKVSNYKMLGNQFSRYQLALFILDLAVVCVSFYGCIFLSRHNSDIWTNPYQALAVAVLAIIIIPFLQTFNLYSYHNLFSKSQHFVCVAKSFVWNSMVYCIICFLYMWPRLFESSSILLGGPLMAMAIGILLLSKYLGDYLLHFMKSMGLALIAIGFIGFIVGKEKPFILEHEMLLVVCILSAYALLLMNRYFWIYIIFNRIMRSSFRRQLLILGTNEQAEKIANHIIMYNAPFWVAGTIGIGNDAINTQIPKHCLGTIHELPSIIEKNKISEIIITDEKIAKQTLIVILDYCAAIGMNVWFPPNLLKIIDIKLYIDQFCGVPMICMCSQKNVWLFNKLKHTFDALITLPIFLLQLPIFFAISIAIKIDSKGPAFYKTKAIGKSGLPFTMYKFRSMRVHNDSDIHKTYVTKLIKGEIGNSEDKTQPLKITNDPRVTRVGKWIRKTSLDELPQLLNVLKGDMSLVGPRPCLPYEFEIYKDWHKKRTMVRPGITGLWQVTGRSEVSFEDMILLDLYYVYNRKFLLDFSILFETIFVVFRKQGAY